MRKSWCSEEQIMAWLRRGAHRCSFMPDRCALCDPGRARTMCPGFVAARRRWPLYKMRGSSGERYLYRSIAALAMRSPCSKPSLTSKPK
jgi:hypothetical protein